MRDSLEVIEDCAEDLEDEVVTPSKPSHGDVTPTNIFDEPLRIPFTKRGRRAPADGIR